MEPPKRLSEAIAAVAECLLALIAAIGATLVLTVPLAVVETRYELPPPAGRAEEAALEKLLAEIERRGIGSTSQIVTAGGDRELWIGGRPMLDLVMDRVPELAAAAGVEELRPLLPELSQEQTIRESGWLVMSLQAAVFLVIGGALIRLRVPAESRPRGGSRRSAVLTGLLGGVAAFGLSLAIAALLYVIGFPVEEQSWARDLFADRAALLRLLPWILIVVPWSEEVFFRGYVLRFLVHRAGLSTAVVISATLFALVHFNPSGFPIYLGVGAVFAWTALRSGSLLAPVTAHAIYNTSVLLAGVATQSV